MSRPCPLFKSNLLPNAFFSGHFTLEPGRSGNKGKSGATPGWRMAWARHARGRDSARPSRGKASPRADAVHGRPMGNVGGGPGSVRAASAGDGGDEPPPVFQPLSIAILGQSSSKVKCPGVFLGARPFGRFCHANGDGSCLQYPGVGRRKGLRPFPKRLFQNNFLQSSPCPFLLPVLEKGFTLDGQDPFRTDAT